MAAALVVAVLANVVAARHYRRWDWTSARLYTLSPATVQTLRSLPDAVEIHVVTSAAEPVTLSIRHMLDAYRAQSERLRVTFTDPDRSPAEYLAIQRRFDLAAGHSVDGRLVADAAVIVARGSQRHFIAADELVAVDDAAEPTARPRLEQALTGAIRRVLRSEQPAVCFTTGHDEDSIDDVGPRGLGVLADRLRRDNYDVRTVSLGGPTSRDELRRCRLAIVAGPRRPFSADEAALLVYSVQEGRSALLALGPVPDLRAERYQDAGLGPVLALGNVRLLPAMVFERDSARRLPQGFGEAFLATPTSHPICAGLHGPEREGVGVFVEMAVPVETDPAAPQVAVSLLESSARSFAMADFFGWARRPDQPTPGEHDRPGPLSLARAAELPTRVPGAAHGPRLVVLGASNVLYALNWQLPELQPSALFVENAVAWLASEPLVLDVPDRPGRVLRLHITEEVLDRVLRWGLLYLPFGAALLGLAVWRRRRQAPRPGPGAAKREERPR